jgi:hypothetical protein
MDVLQLGTSDAAAADVFFTFFRSDVFTQLRLCTAHATTQIEQALSQIAAATDNCRLKQVVCHAQQY